MATQNDRTPLLPLTPASGTHQTTVVVNDFGGVVLSERTRTSGNGNSAVRYTLDIKATPILNDLNGVELGRGPSAAIRDILETQVLNITAVAKPATRTFREKMERAFAGRTESSATRLRRGVQVPVKKPMTQIAQERYGATARTPARPPNQSVRFANDSGRLARGWFVTQNPKEGSWTINSPANRLDPATWGGPGFEAFVARLVDLVPALRDPRTLLDEPAFVRAVANAPPVVTLAGAGGRIASAYARAALSGIRTVVRLVG